MRKSYLVKRYGKPNFVGVWFSNAEIARLNSASGRSLVNRSQWIRDTVSIALDFEEGLAKPKSTKSDKSD